MFGPRVIWTGVTGTIAWLGCCGRFVFFVDPFAHSLAFRFALFNRLGGPFIPALEGTFGLFLGYSTHPREIGILGLVAIKQFRILQEGFNAAVDKFDLGPGDGIVQRVFQLCDPAEVIRSVVAAVDVNMVSNILIAFRCAVIGSANDSVDTFLTNEHIASPLVILTEGPFLVPLALYSIVLALAIDGTIVPDIIPATFIFAYPFFGELVYQFFVFHRQ